MKWLGVFLLSLDRKLVHQRSLPLNLLGFPNNLPVPIYTHLYWVKRGAVRVKCLAQEHNTVFLARAETQTIHSGDEHTNQGHRTSDTSKKDVLDNLILIVVILFKSLETLYKAPYGLLKHLFNGPFNNYASKILQYLLKNGQFQKISIPNHGRLPCFNPPLPSEIPKCITPPCPQNSIIANPPSPSEFPVFLEVHFRLGHGSMNKRT